MAGPSPMWLPPTQADRCLMVGSAPRAGQGPGKPALVHSAPGDLVTWTPPLTLPISVSLTILSDPILREACKEVTTVKTVTLIVSRVHES